MLGAGIVLLIFGIIGVLLGRSLDGGGSDAFALIGLMPTIIGFALIVLGVVSCLIGSFR